MPTLICLSRCIEAIAQGQREAARVGVGVLGIGEPGTEQHEGAVSGVPEVVGLEGEGESFLQEHLADAGIHSPVRALQHGAEVAFALVVGIDGEYPFAGQAEAVLPGEVDAGAVHAFRYSLIIHFEERLGKVDAQLGLPDADGGREMGGGGEVLHPLEVAGGEDHDIGVALVLLGDEGDGVAAVLVVEAELHPAVEGGELQVVIGFGGEQRVAAFVDEAVVVAQRTAQLEEAGAVGLCRIAEAGLRFAQGEVYREVGAPVVVRATLAGDVFALLPIVRNSVLEAESGKEVGLSQSQGVFGKGGGLAFVYPAVGVGEDVLQVQEVVFAADEGVVGAGFQFSMAEGMGQDQFGGIEAVAGVGEGTDVAVAFRLAHFLGLLVVVAFAMHEVGSEVDAELLQGALIVGVELVAGGLLQALGGMRGAVGQGVVLAHGIF